MELGGPPNRVGVRTPRIPPPPPLSVLLLGYRLGGIKGIVIRPTYGKGEGLHKRKGGGGGANQVVTYSTHTIRPRHTLQNEINVIDVSLGD